LLDEEAASGQVPAVFARVGESGTVDLHELRRVVRGPPPLNVSHGPLYFKYAHFCAVIPRHKSSNVGL
jgi:hypothetical protein